MATCGPCHSEGISLSPAEPGAWALLPWALQGTWSKSNSTAHENRGLCCQGTVPTGRRISRDYREIRICSSRSSRALIWALQERTSSKECPASETGALKRIHEIPRAARVQPGFTSLNSSSCSGCSQEQDLPLLTQ